jgi:hypothetical protein
MHGKGISLLTGEGGGGVGEGKKDWSSVNDSILSGMGGWGSWGDISAEAYYKLEEIMTTKGLASRQFISQSFAFLYL